MIGKGITPATKVLLAAGLMAVGILAGAACTKEVEVIVPGTPTVIRETVPGTPTVIREMVPGTPTVVVTEVPVEVPMKLPALAEAIHEGEINVGTEYGLAPGQRYHNIHNTTLGLDCAVCHITSPDTIQTVFTAQDVSPMAPGPVDRRACLGCHRAGGPAEELYAVGP